MKTVKNELGEEGIYLAVTAMSLFADRNRTDENILYIIDPNGEVVIEHVKYGGNVIEGTLLGDGVLQSIENGVTIVRQEDGGVSAHINPYGRFLTTAEHASGETMIFTDLSVLGISTLYPVIGDIVGQLSIAGFLVMVVWAIIVGRKAKQQ